MAGILTIKQLEARKRALVAESEVYRQTLKLEVQNLRLYAVRFQRKLGFFSPANPLMMALPFGLSFLRFRGPRWFQRKRKWRRPGFIGALWLGWRLYRRFGPLFQRLWPRPFPARPARADLESSLSRG